MKNRWFLKLLFIVFIGIFVLRLVYLDSDVPSWGLMNYQPIDEGSYANLALNKINFGSINPNDFYGSNIFFMQGHIINNAIGNFITYLGLFLLGDNYFGLRIPTLLICLLSGILLLISCRTIKKDNKVILIGLIVLCSFQYYNASRVVEPSTIRMLSVSLILFLLTRERRSAKFKGFFIGLIVTFSCFLVYITNVFLYLSLMTYVIYLYFCQEKKEAKELLIFGILGTIIGLTISQIYYSLCWDTNIISNVISTINSFQYDAIYSTEKFSIFTYAMRATNFLSSNLFLYLLPIFIFIVYNIKTIISEMKQKNRILAFNVLCFLAFLLQTIFSEDYIVRKSIVLFPCFLILFYQLITLDKIRVKKSYVLGIISILCSIMIPLYRLFLINNGTNLDFNSNDKILIGILSLATIVYLFCDMFKLNKKIKIVQVLCAIMLLVNATFIYRYNFRNISFYERDGMISLSKYENSVIMGEYINGFTLYNDVKPLLNTEESLRKISQEKNLDLYFDYYDIPTIICDRFKVKTIKQEFEVLRNFKTNGSIRNMGIYRLEEHNND